METIPPIGAILFHPGLLDQDRLTATPEGGRLSLIIEQLTFDGIWQEAVHEADIAPMKRLRDIHDPEYLNSLHKRSVLGLDKLDSATPLMEKSFEIARYGAGGVLDAIDLVMEEKYRTAFCLTAMPGHHAGVSKFGYGSLINPAAAGAQYLTKKYGLKRVLVLDIDSEHGRGTQEIFLKRRDVMFLSIHEYPGLSGTGHYSESGEHPALGYTMNVPFPSGYGDREYQVCLKEIVSPIVKQFEPEFIVLSFGTNLLAEDPSSHLIVSEFGLIQILREIQGIARSVCKGRIVSVLEGGTPGKLMARAVSQHAMLLLNNRFAPVDKGKKEELISYSDWYNYAKLLKNHLRKYWKI